MPVFTSAMITLGAIAIATAADAVTLYSPPLYVLGPGDRSCAFMNISHKPLRDVVTELVDAGTSEGSAATMPELLPGALSAHSSLDAPRLFFCRITFKGSRKAVRISACAAGVGCVSGP